ncbi:MAG TPA: hypothetical protein VNU27_02415 [Candidatus Acidoferrum sp.]|nr:hypothetical protein [Candidatus Acidoferrum sp.]
MGGIQEVLDDPWRRPKAWDWLERRGGGILSRLSDGLALTAAEIARKPPLPVAEVPGRLTAVVQDGAVRRHHDG